MILTVYNHHSDEPIVEREKPTLEEVEQIMQETDWSEFHSVGLIRDDDNWIEVGGAINAGGLAAIYSEAGRQWVIKNAPQTVAQIRDILSSYLQDNLDYKTQYKWEGEPHRKDYTSDYEKWKKEFYAEQRRDKKNFILRLAFSLVLIAAFSYSGYLWYEDEWQFVGFDTAYTTGVITDTYMYHIGRGKYLQKVSYQFEYQNKVYRGTFKAGKLRGRQKAGKKVKVKFASRKPQRSKVVAVYKEK